MLSLEANVFSLNKSNIKPIVKETMDLFSEIENFPYSFNLLLCRYIYSAFIIRQANSILYLTYLKLIENSEEEININNPKIISCFCKLLLELKTRESYYLIGKMIAQKLIIAHFQKNLTKPYFSHYKTKEEILNISDKDIKKFGKYVDTLYQLDLKFHKSYIKEGVNPMAIATFIRNDDVDKLQQIASQANFNFNQRIKPCIYEKSSLLFSNPTLINYSAYFGSVQCFKYLLLNDAKLYKTFRYAIAGGNLEIIHLCEQNDSFFDLVNETAIEYHRNDIFHYFYEMRKKFINLTDLGIKCIQSNNLEILFFLEDEGMEICS